MAIRQPPGSYTSWRAAVGRPVGPQLFTETEFEASATGHLRTIHNAYLHAVRAPTILCWSPRIFPGPLRPPPPRGRIPSLQTAFWGPADAPAAPGELSETASSRIALAVASVPRREAASGSPPAPLGPGGRTRTTKFGRAHLQRPRPRDSGLRDRIRRNVSEIPPSRVPREVYRTAHKSTCSVKTRGGQATPIRAKTSFLSPKRGIRFGPPREKSAR